MFQNATLMLKTELNELSPKFKNGVCGDLNLSTSTPSSNRTLFVSVTLGGWPLIDGWVRLSVPLSWRANDQTLFALSQIYPV